MICCDKAALQTSASSSAASPSTSYSFEIQRPAGLAVDDVMLATVAVRLDSLRKITTPAGWTLIRADRNTSSSSTFVQALYWKRAGSTEGPSYSWRFSSARRASGGILAYRGVSADAPIDSHNGRFTANSTTIPSAPLATNVPDAAVVAFFGATDATHMAPSRLTERYYRPGQGSYTTSSKTADTVQVTAGTVEQLTATTTTRASSAVAQLVAPRPANASSPPPAAPDFSLSLGASSVRLAAGGSAGTSITITPSNGFAGTVLLSEDGLPAGSSLTFDPPSLTSGSAQLTFRVSSTTPAGSYAITVAGTSGSVTRVARLTLTVSTAAPPPTGGVGAALPTRLGASLGTTFYVSPKRGYAPAPTRASTRLRKVVTCSSSAIGSTTTAKASRTKATASTYRATITW